MLPAIPPSPPSLSTVVSLPSSAPRPVARASPPTAEVGSSFRERLTAAADELERSDRGVERALRAASQGEVAPQRLIELQASIYRHSLLVDVASRVVEKTTSAVKQTLTSQA